MKAKYVQNCDHLTDQHCTYYDDILSAKKDIVVKYTLPGVSSKAVMLCAFKRRECGGVKDQRGQEDRRKRVHSKG